MFTGATDGAGSANAATLTIMDSQSLRRIQNFGTGSFGPNSQLNADFALGTPTPASTHAMGTAASLMQNASGEVVLPNAWSERPVCRLAKFCFECRSAAFRSEFESCPGHRFPLPDAPGAECSSGVSEHAGEPGGRKLR